MSNLENPPTNESDFRDADSFGRILDSIFG